VSLRRVIHPSSWKRNSANFVLTEFSEVRFKGISEVRACSLGLMNDQLS
jgi:hypothetical protein